MDRGCVVSQPDSGSQTGAENRGEPDVRPDDLWRYSRYSMASLRTGQDKLLRQLDPMATQQPVGPTDGMRKEQRLEKAIDDYAEIVHLKCCTLRRGFLKDLSVLVVLPVAASVAAALYGNPLAAIGIAGVSGVNVTDRLREGTTLLNKYWDATSKVKKTVPQLKTQLHCCPLSDEECLDKFRDTLREYSASLQF